VFTARYVLPHSVFMCFVWISEKTAIISLYSINWLVFIIEYLNIIQVNLSLWRTVYSVISKQLSCTKQRQSATRTSAHLACCKCHGQQYATCSCGLRPSASAESGTKGLLHVFGGHMVILKSGMSVWVAMVVSNKTAAFSGVILCSLVNCNQYTENKLKRRFSIVSALWTGTAHSTQRWHHLQTALCLVTEDIISSWKENMLHSRKKF
jgi:hypothetical protein